MVPGAVLLETDAFERAVAQVTARVAGSRVERVALAYCDAAGRVLGLRDIGSGMADMAAIPVRRIALDALGLGAAVVVMAHNHPSGEAWPSRADRATTRQIAAALEALEIRLHDHVVVAGRARWSFRAAGLL